MQTADAARLATVAILCAALPAIACAAKIEYAVNAGLGHSDNIARAPAGERGDTVAATGLALVLDEETKRLVTSVVADLAYNKYLNKSFDPEVVGNLDGDAVLTLIDDSLTWSVQDNFGQTRRDQFATSTPANRENINFFGTGPDLHLRIGGDNQIGVAIRYMRVDYETSLLDSRRYLGTMSLAHLLSSASSLGAYLQSEGIQFANATGIPDYDRQSAFLRYALKGQQTTINLDVGANRTQRLGETSDGGLLRLNLDRRIGQFSRLELSLGRELTDAGNSFGTQARLVSTGLEAANLSQSGEPFTSKYVTVAWKAAGRITQLGAQLGWYKESYEQTASLDRRRLLAATDLARNLTVTWSVRFGGQLQSYSYGYSGLDYRETAFSAVLSKRLGRRLNIELSAERFDRRSDVKMTEYNELRTWLRVLYGSPMASAAGNRRVAPASAIR